MSQAHIGILCKFPGTNVEYARIDANVQAGNLTFAFHHLAKATLNEAWVRPATKENLDHIIHIESLPPLMCVRAEPSRSCQPLW
jgi:hypothetical protein